MKGGESGSGKYYYFLLPNIRSIQVGTQYSTTWGNIQIKKLKSETYRLKSETVSEKLFIYENLSRKTNF